MKPLNWMFGALKHCKPISCLLVAVACAALYSEFLKFSLQSSCFLVSHTRAGEVATGHVATEPSFFSPFILF